MIHYGYEKNAIRIAVFFIKIFAIPLNEIIIAQL